MASADARVFAFACDRGHKEIGPVDVDESSEGLWRCPESDARKILEVEPGLIRDVSEVVRSTRGREVLQLSGQYGGPPATDPGRAQDQTACVVPEAPNLAG